jgi:hypothetical protein
LVGYYARGLGWLFLATRATPGLRLLSAVCFFLLLPLTVALLVPLLVVFAIKGYTRGNQKALAVPYEELGRTDQFLEAAADFLSDPWQKEPTKGLGAA